MLTNTTSLEVNFYWQRNYSFSQADNLSVFICYPFDHASDRYHLQIKDNAYLDLEQYYEAIKCLDKLKEKRVIY
jgi:hypothetical protein